MNGLIKAVFFLSSGARAAVITLTKLAFSKLLLTNGFIKAIIIVAIAGQAAVIGLKGIADSNQTLSEVDLLATSNDIPKDFGSVGPDEPLDSGHNDFQSAATASRFTSKESSQVLDDAVGDAQQRTSVLHSLIGIDANTETDALINKNNSSDDTANEESSGEALAVDAIDEVLKIISGLVNLNNDASTKIDAVVDNDQAEVADDASDAGDSTGDAGDVDNVDNPQKVAPNLDTADDPAVNNNGDDDSNSNVPADKDNSVNKLDEPVDNLTIVTSPERPADNIEVVDDEDLDVDDSPKNGSEPNIQDHQNDHGAGDDVPANKDGIVDKDNNVDNSLQVDSDLDHVEKPVVTDNGEVVDDEDLDVDDSPKNGSEPNIQDHQNDHGAGDDVPANKNGIVDKDDNVDNSLPVDSDLDHVEKPVITDDGEVVDDEDLDVDDSPKNGPEPDIQDHQNDHGTGVDVPENNDGIVDKDNNVDGSPKNGSEPNIQDPQNDKGAGVDGSDNSDAIVDKNNDVNNDADDVISGIEIDTVGDQDLVNCPDNAGQNHNLQMVRYMDNSSPESSTAAICDNTEDDVDSDYFASDKSEYSSADIGFIIRGPHYDNTHSGYSVSGAGDVNGDGNPDLIIGAPGFDRDSKGAVYILRSIKKDEKFEADDFDLEEGSENFVVETRYGKHKSGRLGHSVSGAGDVAGNSTDDIIFSEPYFNIHTDQNKGDSASYVLVSKFENAKLNHIKWDPVFSISISDERSGNSVSSAGNFNGDKYDDVIVSVGKYAFVIYGAQEKHLNNVKSGLVVKKTSKGVDAINGVVIKAEKDIKGVSSVGRINKDNYDDVIVRTETDAYVLYGQGKTFKNTQIDLTKLEADKGFRIHFGKTNYHINAISGAGKINGDDLDDVIIGIADEEDNNGASYVLYGQQQKISGPITLSEDYMSSDLGFIIKHADDTDMSGYNVSAAGDVNCDGRDDIIIGTPSASPNNSRKSGATYVVYGSDNKPENINLDALELRNGFMIAGGAAGDQSGFSVSDAGDINNDGCDDVIIGAPYADFIRFTDIGASYVIFGHENGVGNFNLADLDYLGARNDYFSRTIDKGQNRILTINNSIDSLDFSFGHYKDAYLKGTDIINMGNTGSSLKLTPSDVSNIIDRTDMTLKIRGSSSDTLILSNDIDGSTFWSKGSCPNTYKNDNLSVKVSDDVTVLVEPHVKLTPGYIYEDELDQLVDNTAYKVAEYRYYDGVTSALALENGSTKYYLYEPIDCPNSFRFTNKSMLPNPPSGYIYMIYDKDSSGGTLAFSDIKLTASNISYTGAYTGDITNTFTAKPQIFKNVTAEGYKYKESTGGTTYSSISENKGAIEFTYSNLGNISTPDQESTKDHEAHYLKLDESKFNDLEQFTIQIDFKLDFELGYSTTGTTGTTGKRDSNCHHMKQAYLLSLGYDPNDGRTVWDNMLSVYLKDDDIEAESGCGDYKVWDLSVVLEDQLQMNHQDNYIFKSENWINQGERVLLTIAVDLNNSEIKVYEKNTASPDDHIEITDSRDLHNGKFRSSGVENLRVSAGRAIFGNDIDAGKNSRNKRQSFEGRLYSLRVYNKMLDPTQIATDGDRYLHYSVSSDNVVFTED